MGGEPGVWVVGASGLTWLLSILQFAGCGVAHGHSGGERVVSCARKTRGTTRTHCFVLICTGLCVFGLSVLSLSSSPPFFSFLVLRLLAAVRGGQGVMVV